MDISRYKGVIEKTYTDTAKVTVKVNSQASTYYSPSITVQTDAVRYAAMPCRLSYLSSPPATQTDTVADTAATARLFYGADYDIPDGAFVDVTHDGVAERYECVGFAKTYATHKESDMRRIS